MRLAVAALLLLGACAPGATGGAAPTSSAPVATTAPGETPLPPSPTATPAPTPRPIASVIADVSLDRMRDHLAALTGSVSRDPRHPGHAQAIDLLKQRLAAIDGVQVSSQRFTYQAIPMENVLATIDPPGGAPAQGWVLFLAHYDSIAKASAGWRPALDPAPGADDNGTGVAALLEYARILAAERVTLRTRVVLAFVDGEELFFKGSAAYLQVQPSPNPFAAALNIDMVGSNAIADRLDLVWYTRASAALRDRVRAANERYAIGVSPLVEQYATDPAVTIMDIAPWGIAGVPAVALTERYPAQRDASYPGNGAFHTVNDTPENLTNTRLWLKATRLLLAVGLELAAPR